MIANKLRIGNYVNIEGDVVKVKEIYEKSIHYAYGGYESYATEDFIQPIELTEEVLLKIGFELVNTKRLAGYEMVKELENNVYEFFVFKIFDNNDTLLNIRKQKGGGFEYGEFTKRGIKYLHELQNAYYLLTNEELEVKL